MLTGTETSIDFLHSPSTAMRLESISNVVPTRRSCSRASSNGFSRRWDVVTTADTLYSFVAANGLKLDAAASLARCVRIECEVPRVRHRLAPARGGGDHRGVVGADAERRRGRFRQRGAPRRVGSDTAYDPDCAAAGP